MPAKALLLPVFLLAEQAYSREAAKFVAAATKIKPLQAAKKSTRSVPSRQGHHRKAAKEAAKPPKGAAKRRRKARGACCPEWSKGFCTALRRSFPTFCKAQKVGKKLCNFPVSLKHGRLAHVRSQFSLFRRSPTHKNLPLATFCTSEQKVYPCRDGTLRVLFSPPSAAVPGISCRKLFSAF